MLSEERRHIEAQIQRLLADAKRHSAISKELEAQADRMHADLQRQPMQEENKKG